MSVVRFTVKPLSLAILSSAMLSQLTLAQIEPSMRMEETVVTAQKRSQDKLDVPLAVQVFSEEFLVQQRITDMSRVSDLAPGIAFSDQQPDAPTINVRGIVSDAAGVNAEPSVSVFLDGFDISRREGSSVALFDIRQVEIVKGPQGSLFGTSSQNGGISIITRKPEFEQSAYVRAGAGDYNSNVVELMGNVAVSDTVALRISGLHEENDGYIKNLAGKDLMARDTNAARASGLWQATEDLEFKLSYHSQQDETTGTQFTSSEIVGPNDRIVDPYWNTAQNDKTGVDRDTDLTQLTADWTLNESFSLYAMAGLRNVDVVQDMDNDGSQYSLLYGDIDFNSKTEMADVRLAYSDGSRWNGFIGASYMQESADQSITLTFDETFMINAFQNAALQTDGSPNTIAFDQFAGLGILFDTARSEHDRQTGDKETTSLYADIEYDVSERLSLGAGLRWNRDERTFNVYRSSDSQSAINQLAELTGREAADNLLFVEGNQTGAGSTYRALQPRFTANYRLSDEQMVWAGVSQGQKSGFVEYLNDGSVNKVDPENLTNFELGFKAQYDRVSLDTSVFYYDWKDIQNTVYEGNAGGAKTVNAQSADALGLELATNFILSESFTGFVNGSYIDAKMGDFVFDTREGQQDYSGNSFRLTSKYTAALGIDYLTSLSEQWDVFANLSYNWRSKLYFDLENDNAKSQDAYGLVDGRIGLTRDALTFSLWGSNLMNEEYLVDSGNTSGNVLGIDTLIAGRPRMVGAEISYNF